MEKNTNDEMEAGFIRRFIVIRVSRKSVNISWESPQ